MTDKLVVVDDDPDMVKMITLNLTKQGFKGKGFLDAEGLFRFLDKKRKTE